LHQRDYDNQTGSCYCGDVWDESRAQSDTGQPEREWTASEFDGNLDGYPLLSPEGLAAIATDPEYQARILVSVNSHASLIAALERTQKFLLLLTDAGVLDQIAAEHSHPDEVNGLCDAVDEALRRGGMRGIASRRHFGFGLFQTRTANLSKRPQVDLEGTPKTGDKTNERHPTSDPQ
jgi:hypothetical protein